MKRSYESQEKITTQWNERSVSDPCPENTRNGIVPDISLNLDCRREDSKSQAELAKSRFLEDSAEFQSRITSKLRSVLDGFSSKLQSISGDEPSPEVEELTLQNFIHSAKSQISGLLRKQPGGVSNEKSSLKSFPKSPRVDPLQIQISLKLQDLLCKALDDRLRKDVVNSNSVEEQELEDLSGVLSYFLRSAKKKISISLTAGESGALECESGKMSRSEGGYLQIENKVPIAPSKMDDSDSCDSSAGILLLGEAEKAPDYLDLSLEVGEESDIDDPGFKNDVDSEEEVVVLGEKKPTYQEITIDEEECEEVFEEQVVEKRKVRIPRDLEDLLYDCPKCEKKFRVESLLKFHVRMHSVVESHRAPAEASVSTEMGQPNKAKSRKEKENKLSSKSSHPHKIQKHSRRRVKMTS